MEYSDMLLLKKYWLFVPLISFYLHQFTSLNDPILTKSNRKKDYKKNPSRPAAISVITGRVTPDFK